MRKFNCDKHGETQAVSTDDLLLRYGCSDCELEKEHEEKEEL